jgi:hypothetical protein
MDSLAKLTTEPVSSNLSRWIRNEWIGSDRIGSDQPTAVLGQNRAATTSPTAVPLLENAIARFTALSHERKTPGWSGEQGELTKVRDEDGVDPETVWCSGWRTVVAL